MSAESFQSAHELEINLESVSLRIEKKDPFHFHLSVDYLFCKSRETAVRKDIFQKEIFYTDARSATRDRTSCALRIKSLGAALFS